ncbi:hypothetical protein [Brachybacterium sp. UMB0905]|nr:hypothetical protein [Brachybacterium sp. UMB0905]
MSTTDYRPRHAGTPIAPAAELYRHAIRITLGRTPTHKKDSR